MKIKLIGIQEQEYTLDNGYYFNGKKLHVIDLDSAPEGQIGNQVTNFKISNDSQLASIPLECGATYEVYFNNKGKLDALIPLK